jgi:hypothetical protein
MKQTDNALKRIHQNPPLPTPRAIPPRAMLKKMNKDSEIIVRVEE